MLNDGWHFFAQDIALIGGLHSPLLSWLGAALILALGAWHSVVLITGVAQIHRAFGRVLPALARLAKSRRASAPEWIVIPALAKKQAALHTAPARRDLDDLIELDHAMRTEPVMAAEWLAYRKTLALEQSSWFVEPTVHSGRSAAEFFSFEALCSARLNLRLYQQLPGFLTGIGLMFTFLAILVGLGKLHANGSHIDGLQGLINGLAGKFVTSIVGLACANVFTFLEKSLWHRLAADHRQVISLIDGMFAQAVTDHGNPHPGLRTIQDSVSVGQDSGKQLVEAVHQRLGAAVSALTTVSQSFAERESHPRDARLASDIGREVQQALTPLLTPLLTAIQDLAQAVDRQRTAAPLFHLELDQLFDRLRQRLDGEFPAAMKVGKGQESAGWLARLRVSPQNKVRQG
jgi:hypothetical protein